MPRSRLALFLALALITAGSSGCLTRPIRKQVFQQSGTEVFLRSYKRGTSTLPQGYAHPVEIAPVRLAHILSRIDMRAGDHPKRVPAIPLEKLYDIADGMALALAQAGPDEQVVIQSQRKKKNLLVFDHFYLTSLLAYMKDELLYIQISRSDWEVEKRREKTTGLPETRVGKYPLNFRLIVDKGMTLADHQSVAVQWRDDIFRKPTRTRVTPTGRVVRRQVLMESLEDESIERAAPSVSAELSPQQLRALADLEEDRQAGSISETEYQSQRSRILRGEPAPL
ncbi:MAG: hypothetical protein JRH16_00875 [Deltaproteobacteria bacterium]|nr:hypothetical protein [Deltaproteobacteria bacterium]